MTLRAVRLGAGSKPERYDLGSDPEKSLGAEKAKGPSVLLLRNADLADLRPLTRLVVDRGRKHPAKELSKVLLGHTKIPLVHGSYSAAGQLLRSTRALLEHAVRKNEQNVYVVGVDDGVFKEIWEKADAKMSSTAFPLERSSSAQSLLDLLSPLPVPERVRRRLIGSSVEIRLVHQLIVRAAKNDDPVLVLGDTGTGKEVVARLIHEESKRGHMTFTAVNCGAIPKELFESELFGAEPGSHSMAFVRKIGLWLVAHGGTLFLDEMGDLSLDHQVKILRTLQEGTIRPLGAIKEIKVDARVIAATNRDVFAMVQRGEFREDLYYRLRSVPIRTPALRDHPEDVPQLAAFFWKQITRNESATLPGVVVAELQTYRWPGNARELRAVLSSLFSLFGAEGIGLRHLKAVFQFEGHVTADPGTPPAEAEILHHRVECLRHVRRTDEVLRAFRVALRPFLDQKKTDPGTIQAVRQNAELRLRELEALSMRPLLFGSERTYSAVHDLKNKFFELLNLLVRDPEKAASYWRGEITGDLRAVLAVLFEEVERLVRG